MIRQCSTDNPFASRKHVSKYTLREAIRFLQSEGVRLRLAAPGKVTAKSLFNLNRYRKVGVLFVIAEAHQRGMTPRSVECRESMDRYKHRR